MGDPIKRHVGQRVVAHVGSTSLEGLLLEVSRETVVLRDATLLESAQQQRPVDGVQLLDRRGLWLQVAAAR